MPLETINYNNSRYEIITANKRHEPPYRKQLSKLIQQKFGNKIDRADVLSALKTVSIDFIEDDYKGY